MRRALLAIAIAGAPAVVLAQYAPTDFARGADIRAAGGSLFRLTLPDDVYATVVRADLGDLRVLNAAGEAVPHTLRRARPAAAESEWRNAPSFPMSSAQSGRPARTQVRVDANGAVLEVTGDPERTATTAYLVDVSAIDQPLTRLSLTWSAPAGVTFLSRVSVEGSDDLNTWRTLVGSAAVAQLQRDALLLIQNEIALPESGARVKYLRISWPRDMAAATLTAVRVRPRAATQAEIRWRTLTATGVEPSGAPVYDAGGLYPVEYLDLEFQDSSDAAEVAIRSRATPEDGWSGRHRGLFYALQDPSGAIHNEPAQTGLSPHRYWTVERIGSGGWAAGRAPRLKIGWHPHELIFVAQGAAPYMLVYGSARAGSVGAPVEALAGILEQPDRAAQMATAIVDAPRSLGGADALTPPWPVRRFVLWGVLVAAVALLALFAMRLFKETGKTGTSAT